MKPVIRQSWTVLGAVLHIVASGFQHGYLTVLLRDLKAPGSNIALSSSAESWIASAIAVTTFPSFLLAAPVLEKFGRRAAPFCIATPSIVSCLLLYYARDATTLLAARLVCGFSTGPTIVIAAIIVGEYTSPETRGVFLNAKSAGHTLGTLYVHTIGTFFDWRITALFGLIPSVLSVLIATTWPESPSWLAYKGRYEACKESFVCLRGNSENAKEELLLLIQSQRNRRICEDRHSSLWGKVMRIVHKLGRSDFRKPTWIALFIYVILEACGRHSFPAYAVKFMSAFAKDETTTLYYVLTVDLLIFLSSVASCGIIKLFRRRTLLFTSGGISCVLLVSICIYLYLKSKKIAPEEHVWLPLTLLCLYFIVLNLGTSSIALSLLGEIYPLDHRGLGTMVTGIWSSLSLLVTLKVTPALMAAIDVHGTFFVYAISMAGSLVYLYLFLPETDGRTLLEIEHHFNGVSLELEKDNEKMVKGKTLKGKKSPST